MNLKEFNSMVREDTVNNVLPLRSFTVDEIGRTFKNYEESLRLLHNCLLTQKPNVKFWGEVENFLSTKLEEI
ncbi:hypothetical protein LCGC14_1272160 [marine sediment metagenome]|uniref:Uncharacterized protein n=1 Tax=marine sediment metagenome TaxID=412755 RepID=A0A0F9KZK6_9ZZZZ